MPEAIHGYELVALLGHGGMGRVYRGLHLPSRQPVAIKTLRSELRGDALRKRLLLNEATAAAQLRHPNIVELLDVGRDEQGTPFLVMELVEGQDLEAWALEWPGWPAVARAFDDALAGLVAAHAAGVIHRDLKPGNLLLALDGRVKIADFGIAQVRDPVRSEGETDGPVGTPAYMAPEQFVGSAGTGPWTDLYAVGVMLHHLITGYEPFPQARFLRLMALKLTQQAPPAVPRPGLEAPPELLALVDELLRTDPRRRPRFAQEVRERLGAAAPRVIDGVELARTAAAERGDDPEANGAGAAARDAEDTATRVHDTAFSPAPPTDASEESGAGAWRSRPPSEPYAVRAGGTEPTLAATDSGVPSPDTHSVPLALSLSPATPAPGMSIAPSLPVRLPAAPDAHPGASLLRLRELPLVGRAAERDLVAALVDETCTRGGVRLLALLGEAGVGKSRIARWGLAEVERRALMEGVAAGYDVAGGALAGGLRLAVRRLLGLPDRRASDGEAYGVPAEWRWLIPDGAAEPPFDAVRLERWLRAAGTEELLPPAEVAELAHAAVRAAARVRPVYLWVDDLGWARDGALELCERLLAAQDAPVLLVVTLRSGTAQYPPLRARLEALWRTPAVAQVRTLEPLAPEERRGLIQSVVPVDDAVAAALAARVDGTPLHVVQLVHEWIESGLLVAGPQGWHPRAGAGVDDLLAARPLEALIGERVRAMLATFLGAAAEAEGVLLRAALLGTRFEEGVLRAAVEQGAAHPGGEAGGDDTLGGLVDDVLDRALLHGLLRAERGRAYRFDHGLVQDCLLARLRTLPDADRRRALLDTAAGLHAYYGRERAGIAARVAALWREAGNDDDAWQALCGAVGKAAKAGDDQAAGEHVATARRWLEDDAAPAVDARRARVELADAHAHYYAIRYDAALAALARGDALYAALGDETGVARCRGLVADTYFYQDRFADAERVATEVIALAREDDPERALVGSRAYGRLADLAVMRDDLDAARQLNRRAYGFAEATGDPWAVYLVGRDLANLQIVRGDLTAADALLRDVVRVAREARDETAFENALVVEARLWLYRGEAARAREQLASVLRKLEGRGDRWLMTEVRLLEALLAAELDPPATVAAAVHRFVTAFGVIAHDEVQSRYGMRRLHAKLAERGEAALAGEVQRLIDSRMRSFADTPP
ncbi:MAG TPA: protein kinase [Myxococcota bacterium]|nr:protein kinase [Myxococcota bacterium]